MSIRVLDLVGRVCRPLSVKKAVREVARKHANWLHSEGVEPNQQHGTIILSRQLKEQPTERAMAQLYNGDGQLLMWIWPEVAGTYLRRGLVSLVGECSPSGPRAVMVPHCVSHEVMTEICHYEYWGTAMAVEQRATMRVVIEKALQNRFSEWYVEKLVEEKLKSFFKKGHQVEAGLHEIRKARRQLAALELALAPDCAGIRIKLAEQLVSNNFK